MAPDARTAHRLHPHPRLQAQPGRLRGHRPPPAGEGVRVIGRPEKGADAFVINTCSVTHVADRKARHLARLARRLSPDATSRPHRLLRRDRPRRRRRAHRRRHRPRQRRQAADRRRSSSNACAERGDPAAGCPTPVRQPRCAPAPSSRSRKAATSSAPSASSPAPAAASAACPSKTSCAEVQARESGRRAGSRAHGHAARQLRPRPRLAARRAGPAPPAGSAAGAHAACRASASPRCRRRTSTPALLGLWRDPRLCPHFHLPLQSGSDAVLAPHAPPLHRRPVPRRRRPHPRAACPTWRSPPTSSPASRARRTPTSRPPTASARRPASPPSTPSPTPGGRAPAPT